MRKPYIFPIITGGDTGLIENGGKGLPALSRARR